MANMNSRLRMWRDIGVTSLVLSASLFVSSALRADGQDQTKPVTFSKDIAPILQEKCQGCHRPGQIAPMSLLTYQDVRPWARAIKDRVVARQMPPWHLDKTVGIQDFENDISLSDEQIQTIARWVDAGAPSGDPKDMPPAKNWANDDGWQLAKQFGPPDLILKSEPYTMPARGQDVWFKPLTPIPIDEPRWVRAVEIRPGTLAGRKITHHALAFLQQEEPGSNTGTQTQGLLMEWAVNKNYDIYRPNTGKLLLPGARIWWEMHYHAVGEEIRDHVELAVYFYPKGEAPKYRTFLTAFPATPGTAAFQRTFAVLLQCNGTSFSVEWPSPSGPRQPGQLPASAGTANSRTITHARRKQVMCGTPHLFITPGRVAGPPTLKTYGVPPTLRLRSGSEAVGSL